MKYLEAPSFLGFGWDPIASLLLTTDVLHSSLTFWLLLRSCVNILCLRKIKLANIDLTLILLVCNELFSVGG